MSDTVYVEKVDNVYVKIHAEPSIKMEMNDYFSFFAKNYQFMPAYKNKFWDGKIRLLNTMTGLIYGGLLTYIAQFCKSRNYRIKIDPELMEVEDIPENYGIELAKEFGATLTPHDYQNRAVVEALSQERKLFLSPTASGKSFIIYLIARYHAEKHNRKVLIIDPTISLVLQLEGDFTEYNNGKKLDIHKIQGGADKNVEAAYTISTWQSLQRMPASFFSKFDVVIVDEAHLASAKSITGIMEKCPHVRYRYGLTGTIDDSETHKLVLTGLFGNISKVITTKELIDQNKLSSFKINGLILEYSNASRKLVSKMDYQAEIDWIVSHERRNKYICNLADNLPGNTLILFQFVEKHGMVLEKMLKESKKTVHFIHGKVDGEVRNDVRKIVESSNDNIILASYGTFSTGVNIKRLDNLIMASPSKSKIRNLQSIGRVLRKGNGSDSATLYDIADDLQWKKKQNYAVKHFLERIKIYSNEKFKYKIYNVELEKE